MEDITFEQLVRAANERGLVVVTREGLEDLLELAHRNGGARRRVVLARIWLQTERLPLRTRLRLRPLMRILS